MSSPLSSSGLSSGLPAELCWWVRETRVRSSAKSRSSSGLRVVLLLKMIVNQSVLHIRNTIKILLVQRLMPSKQFISKRTEN